VNCYNTGNEHRFMKKKIEQVCKDQWGSVDLKKGSFILPFTPSLLIEEDGILISYIASTVLKLLVS